MTDSTTAQPVNEEDLLSKDEIAKRRRQAYSNAAARLREENRKKFDAMCIEEAAKLGVTYTPRPSEEDKAYKQIKDLLVKHPDLASEVALYATQMTHPDGLHDDDEGDESSESEQDTTRAVAEQDDEDPQPERAMFDDGCLDEHSPASNPECEMAPAGDTPSEHAPQQEPTRL